MLVSEKIAPGNDVKNGRSDKGTTRGQGRMARRRIRVRQGMHNKGGGRYDGRNELMHKKYFPLLYM